MAIFPRLKDPASYRVCESDLIADAAARAHWLEVFRAQFDDLLAAALDSGYAAARCAEARVALHQRIDRVEAEPGFAGRLDLLVLDGLRREALAVAGIDDAYRSLKAAENERALASLPDRLAEDPRDPARWERIAGWILAGNLFDAGVPGGTNAGRTPAELRARVPPRPWFIDDLDAAATHLTAAPPRRAVLFTDNAGADVVLGVLPLARVLLLDGAEVVLTANERPSLNDVTHDELTALASRAAALDPIFASPRLDVVSSGSGSPLIDLTDVSDELAAAAAGAELVVLVGMGRGLESNWRCRFDCAAWRLATVKDPQVARGLGASLMDAVCRFES